MELNFGRVKNLPDEEQRQLNELVKIWRNHKSANRKKRRYYNGDITLAEVNLGIALPSRIGKLEIGCAWGAKTVDVLAGRSIFDGFVSGQGKDVDTMTAIMKRNRFIAEYNKACKEELKYGCSFAAISGDKGAAKIRFHTPHCAAGKWNDEKGRLDCGFAFADLREDELDINWSPDEVAFYTENTIWILKKDGGWTAEGSPHEFGKPMIVPLVWDATNDKPFGQSRIKGTVRRFIEGYVRTLANAAIALEFATSPQKYILGVTDEQFDALTESKFKQYVGNILATTGNPETGTNPTFGQLQQGSLEPAVQMLRMLATQYSAATGLPITDTGVINDANPTSSDAILAQTQTLVQLATQLNEDNGNALNEIALMAQAVELGTTPDALPEENKDIVAHFKNPALPNVASTADAAVKIATSRPEFSNTDVFLEMLGFSQADIRRIKAQEQRVRGQKVLMEIDNDNIKKGLE